MFNIPFNILDIVQILNFKIKYKNEISMTIDCPFCDKPSEMGINLKKNIFNCNHCKTSGNAISLYAKVFGISNLQAYDEISNILELKNKSINYRTDNKQIIDNLKIKILKRVSLEDIHKTYSNLLSLLSLYESHKKYLLKKGFTENQIEIFGYKSIPIQQDTSQICEALLKNNCKLAGVPGFYTNINNRWSINLSNKYSGILIPIRSINNKIQSLQILLDVPIDNKEYIWFSSSCKNNGTSSEALLHFRGNCNDKTIYITTKALKADTSYAISGKTFIAISRENQYKILNSIFPILKKNGTQELVITFDMNTIMDLNIEQSIKNLVNLSSQYGFKVHRLKWNNKYKGIDDYLLMYMKNIK